MEPTEIIVFGSAIVDFICYSPRLPKSGETLRGTKFCTGFGGKGGNQCVAAARMGAKCALIAKVGDDQWGRDYLTNLQEEKVNTKFVESVPSETTGKAVINVSDTGENQIVIVTGANNKLSVQNFTVALEELSSSKILICQLETPLIETINALRWYKEISILNASPAIENPTRLLIMAPSILCMNASEASVMTGIQVETIQHAKNAIIWLKELGAKSVIVTMGEKGAVCSQARRLEVYHVPTKKVSKVIDTTGAGDAFIGALAYYLAKDQDLPLVQAVGAACEIASFSVQFPGTQSSFPYVKDVMKLGLEKRIFVASEL